MPLLRLCLLAPQCPGDQLAIAKETGRRLGMGTNMYPSSSLLGQDKDAAIAALPVDELIEKADGFAGVFPGEVSCLILMLFFSFSFSKMHLHSFSFPYHGNLQIFILLIFPNDKSHCRN
jgi:hypothetical protein